jgi:hypothetical protein
MERKCKINLEHLHRFKHMKCPCLTNIEENKSPEKQCPCDEFTRDGKCRCGVFECE